MFKTIHPFPARMAPELALEKLSDLAAGSVVLDPMAGSGTVVRQATELGHSAMGFDMDPLAVLMTKVWTTPLDEAVYDETRRTLAKLRGSKAARNARLPWIDDDPETAAFIDFWFGAEQ